MLFNFSILILTILFLLLSNTSNISIFTLAILMLCVVIFCLHIFLCKNILDGTPQEIYRNYFRMLNSVSLFMLIPIITLFISDSLKKKNNFIQYILIPIQLLYFTLYFYFFDSLKIDNNIIGIFVGITILSGIMAWHNKKKKSIFNKTTRYARVNRINEDLQYFCPTS